jgi:hypothetical protein
MTRHTCSFCLEEYPVDLLERGFMAARDKWFCRDVMDCCRTHNAKRAAEREAGQ